jgi:hypothetical protein
MLCDGRGAGLLQKVRGLELGRTQGLDTSDVYRLLGLEQDPRDYERVATVYIPALILRQKSVRWDIFLHSFPMIR